MISRQALEENSLHFMEISHLSQSSDRFNCNSFVERDVKCEASGA